MEFLLSNSTPFLKAFKKYAINTPKRVAHFLAQLHEETGGFIKLSENLNYTPAGLIETFGTNQISVAQANLYGRTAKRKANQEAIAFILPQENVSASRLADYIVTVDAVEDQTGLDFFTALPDEPEEAMESQRMTMWGN